MNNAKASLKATWQRATMSPGPAPAPRGPRPPPAGPAPRDLLLHAVGGRHNPVGGDDGASADVDALDVQADLPGPVAQRCAGPAHDPALAVAHLPGDSAL